MPTTPSHRAIDRKATLEAISPLAINDDSNSEPGIMGVDTDDDADRLYMIDEDGERHYIPYTTFTPSRLGEEPPLECHRTGHIADDANAEVQVNLQCQIQLALRALKRTESGTAKQKKTSEVEKTDLILRNDLCSIKDQLWSGATFLLEHLPEHSNNRISCAYQGCPNLNRRFQDGAYYLILDQPGQPDHKAYRCLSCVEALWHDDGILAPLPEASLLEPIMPDLQRSLDGLCLDGVAKDPVAARDNSGDCEQCHTAFMQSLTPSRPTRKVRLPSELMQSRWADTEYVCFSLPEDQITASVRADSPHTSEAFEIVDSPVREELTRFQKVAKHVSAGHSLDEEEKKVLELWKTDDGFRGMELSVALSESRDSIKKRAP
ncbi:hypothetical protein LTR62_004897 [Meristemomyces frigidus]|uniref:Uncharacterized protein n=1 Tax=Meristemomyces frigidus TaxID=1508187 RepID=A0AAN7TE06_9PEZI|nr:hypothetical protein LTR62_004897 [Meristemomyces frigidus]